MSFSLLPFRAQCGCPLERGTASSLSELQKFPYYIVCEGRERVRPVR
jgi:hypothetical protein